MKRRTKKINHWISNDRTISTLKTKGVKRIKAMTNKIPVVNSTIGYCQEIL